jgi:predicted PurR-regulated permease PerM
MNDENLQRNLFIALLVGVTIAFIWLVRGFLQPIFWAVALGVVFFPAHEYLERRLSPRSALAAMISVAIVLFVVIFPIIGIATAVTAEAADLFQRLNSGEIGLAEIYARIEEWVPALTDRLESLGFELERLQQQLSSSAIVVSQFIASQALQLGQNTIRITVYFFLTLYLLFFFLKDSRRILDGLVNALPIGDERERQLLERFAEVSRATIKGTLVVGVVQGTIGGVAFALLGLSAPVMWGVVMALLSIIPAVGPAIVWVPAAVILIAGGNIVSGIILVIVGALVIGLADNLLRPILVGRDTRMPDYLILLSTLGGLTAFGLAGVVIGPIIAAFFLSVWEMAEEEFAGIEQVPLAGTNGDAAAESNETTEQK